MAAVNFTAFRQLLTEISRGAGIQPEPLQSALRDFYREPRYFLTEYWDAYPFELSLERHHRNHVEENVLEDLVTNGPGNFHATMLWRILTNPTCLMHFLHLLIHNDFRHEFWDASQ